jgi:CheY-specific phosphatase CheX
MPEMSINQVLTAATTDVLETMFFTPVMGDTAAASASGDLLAARLDFSGGLTGTLAVQVTMPAAREIAANFIGGETDQPHADAVGDVIAELANMVCGSVLSHLDGEAHFDLTHPRLIDPLSAASPQSASRTLEIEGGEVTLFLYLDKKP